MSNAYLCPILQDCQFNSDGTFLAGGLIWFYEAGTSTPALSYTGPNADTAWTNPIVLDQRGETGGEIWLSSGQSYKIIVEGPPYYGETHGPVINTFDNISGVNDPQGGTSSANWIVYSGSPVYVSSSSFSVSGDQRAIFVYGRRVKLSKSSGVAYGTVIDSVFSLGSTTITVSVDYGNSINSSINLVSYGAIETGPISSIPVPIYAGSYAGDSAYNLWMNYDGSSLYWAHGNNPASINWPINAASSDTTDLATAATSANNGIFNSISANLGPSGTGARVFGATYTNSTSVTMVVYVSLSTVDSTDTGYAFINGSEIYQWQGASSGNIGVNFSFIVHSGATYKVTYSTGSGATISMWVEQTN